MDATQQTAAPQAQQQLTPEQVKQMQVIVRQALSHLLDEQASQLLVDKAKSGDPKQVVADAVAPVLQSVYAAAEEAGVKLEMLVILGAGIQVVGVMAKMLESVGILSEDQIPAFCADVAKLAVAQHNASVQQRGMVGQPQGAMQ